MELHFCSSYHDVSFYSQAGPSSSSPVFSHCVHRIRKMVAEGEQRGKPARLTVVCEVTISDAHFTLSHNKRANLGFPEHSVLVSRERELLCNAHLAAQEIVAVNDPVQAHDSSPSQTLESSQANESAQLPNDSLTEGRITSPDDSQRRGRGSNRVSGTVSHSPLKRHNSKMGAHDRVLETIGGETSPGVLVGAQNQSSETIDGGRNTRVIGAQNQSSEALSGLDRDAIAALLQESISALDGKLVHDHIVRTGLEQDTFLANLLISTYGRHGLVEEALAVFEKLSRRTVVTWSATISICTQHGRSDQALSLFRQMQQEEMKPNSITFISVLTACASLSSLNEGEFVHAQIIQDGIDLDVVVGTALLNMYGKCLALEAASAVFNKMPVCDAVSWNALIAANEQGGQGAEAIELFQRMLEEGVEPNHSTYISTLTACASIGAIEKGYYLHACIIKDGWFSFVTVGNSLIHMYGKCKATEEAWAVFNEMQQYDVVSWNIMIAVYAQEGLYEDALKLLERMLQAGVKPTHVTYLNSLSSCTTPEALATGKVIHEHIAKSRRDVEVLVGTALVSMYGKCGDCEAARKVFNRIRDSDLISWNAMIVVYSQQGYYLEALHLYNKMLRKGWYTNEVTYSGILGACAEMAALPEGQLIHASLVENGYDSNIVVTNALIHMYGKCGRLDEARVLFDILTPQELVSWNVMITAYAQQGHGKKAVELYQKMQEGGVRPNEVTFVSLLSACSHAGLVDEGHTYFISMKDDYGIRALLEHYACLIDLYGRAGRLEEAENLLNSMPIKPNAAVWSAFLSSCRVHGDIKRVKYAAKKLLVLEPKRSTPYVILCNIYSAEGRWEDVESIQKAMVLSGVESVPGCSWVKVKNKMHRFLVHDRTHSKTDEIYAELEKLDQQMKEAKEMPDMNLVLHDVEDEVKEHVLSHHSEKLAVAFGLISTPFGAPLYIKKNLRLCSHCHNTMKFVSKSAEREINVRDSTGLHRFQHGLCSCGDYW